MSDSEKAILKTLIYSDVFNFPLTKEEIWLYLSSPHTISRKDFDIAIQRLTGKIIRKDGFFCLSGRAKCIDRRLKLANQTAKKIRIARKAAYFLSFIPTIQFIGISGGLAIGNAKKDDDIDLFIITKEKTLYGTRLWTLLMLEFLDLRRKRTDNSHADKICVNLIIEETRLSWALRLRDEYVAHEILQLKPLFDRGSMYGKFLKKNNWIKKYFPNAPEEFPFKQPLWNREYYTLKFLSRLNNSTLIESVVRGLQKHSIKKHQTIETVTDNFLAFHPHDYRGKTLEMLSFRYKQYGLLTKP